MTGELFGRAERDWYPRCWRCGRLFAVLLTRPWKVVCPRCKASNAKGDVPPEPEHNPG